LLVFDTYLFSISKRSVEFLNAPEFLNLMREITGIPEIAWTDGQATLYKPGNIAEGTCARSTS
jgi:hypothetical protein